jgi:hypothetical protein
MMAVNDKDNDNALHNGNSDLPYPFPDRLPFLESVSQWRNGLPPRYLRNDLHSVGQCFRR